MRPTSPSRPDEANYSIARADWDDGGAAPNNNGLSARAEAAGFSPIRLLKSRQHALDVDPRTKLPIIPVPAERRVAFADLQDVVIHIFTECYKITTHDSYVERVLVITDQTLFLCTKEGAAARCVMVDAIKSLSVTNDNRALGIQIPSEYDILLRFGSSADRDRTIKVLRTVYRRLAHARLPVQIIQRGKKLDPKEFNLTKPQDARMPIIQQRTVEQLREALLLFEAEEEAMLEEIDVIQEELEQRHRANMEDMQTQLEGNLQRLKDVVKSVWENEQKLQKLRADVSAGRKLIEQVDGPFGPDGQLPVSKDATIAELEMIVARLNVAVYTGTSEDARRGEGDALTYFQKDLQEQLYEPAWPGQEDVKDVQSLVEALQQKVKALDEEIQQAKRSLEEGQAAEVRLKFVEERIAFLKQQRRTQTFARNHAGQLGGGAAEMGFGGGVGGGGGARGVAGGGGGGPGSPQGRGNPDPSFGFLADLPQDITVENLTVDPRTGLHLVRVPDVVRTYFRDLSDAVLHYFAVVRKPSKSGELVKRVLMISDCALYLCTPNGTIKRCLEVSAINEILLDRNFGIGIRCSADYDLTAICATGDHRQEMVDILQKIYRYLTQGKSIPVMDIPRHQRLEAFLKLTPPQGYIMQLTAFRTRQELVDAIQQRRDLTLHNAGGMAIAPLGSATAIPVNLGSLSEADYIKLRQDVAMDMDAQWRQDATLVMLREEKDQLEMLVRAATDEVQSLKRRIQDHRCEDGVAMAPGSYPVAPGGGIIPSSGPGTFRPASSGHFFIRVEPETLSCELDVHRVTFNQELLFTGHNNGFVNAWNLSAPGRPLVRTLREHIGKVTALCCTEVDLLTASMDSTIRLWNLREGKVSYRLTGHRGGVCSAYMAENRIVSGGLDTFVHVWDQGTGEQISSLRGHKSTVIGVKHEGNILVSVEWGWALMWDLRSSKVERTLRDDHGGISSFDFCDGLLACGGCGGDLTIWDMSRSTGETIHAHNDDVLCVQLAGRSVISSGGDMKVKLWDATAMRSLGTFYDAHPFEPKSFRMEERTFVVAEGPNVKIWTK